MLTLQEKLAFQALMILVHKNPEADIANELERSQVIADAYVARMQQGREMRGEKPLIGDADENADIQARALIEANAADVDSLLENLGKLRLDFADLLVTRMVPVENAVALLQQAVADIVSKPQEPQAVTEGGMASTPEAEAVVVPHEEVPAAAETIEDSQQVQVEPLEPLEEGLVIPPPAPAEPPVPAVTHEVPPAPPIEPQVAPEATPVAPVEPPTDAAAGPKEEAATEAPVEPVAPAVEAAEAVKDASLEVPPNVDDSGRVLDGGEPVPPEPPQPENGVVEEAGVPTDPASPVAQDVPPVA